MKSRLQIIIQMDLPTGATESTRRDLASSKVLVLGNLQQTGEV